MWNNLLPRSPPIRIVLLFHGPDQVSPDLCCPRIALLCSDWLTSVPLQPDRALLQDRMSGSVHLPRLLVVILFTHPESQFLQEVGSYLKASFTFIDI